MNLLILDLETTGLDSEINGIVSICAKLFNKNRELVTSFTHNCNPEYAEINLGALKVNRFSIENIGYFKPEQTVVKFFCDWLLGLKIEGELVLAGHNTNFDLSFLKAKLRKYNINGFDQAVSHKVVDTATIGRFLVMSGVLPENTKISLKDLAIACDVEYDATKHHNAEYDVDLTTKLLFKMIDMVNHGKNK